MGRLTLPGLAVAAYGLSQAAAVLGAGMSEPALHAHHHMMMARPAPTLYRMTDFKVPPIRLVREDRKSVMLADELNDGRPVIVNFIYTSCTETCPLTTHTFAELQDKLGDARTRVHMASISIDPEQDTPTVLAKYARRFGAGSQWHFYTGTVAASVAAQRAFNVYLGDKMSHNPVTFIRVAPDRPWLRIDGLAKPDELLTALRDLAAGKTWLREAAAHAGTPGVPTTGS